ncbi:MAG TPA: hypothetical protein VGL00_10600, partial [Terracidiphilus sp.]
MTAQTAISAPPPAATLSSTQPTLTLTQPTLTSPTLTSPQIVSEMLRHNRQRAEELKHYQSIRHYEVEYKGYSAKIDAKLVVEADYDAANGKSFKILSQSGN